MKKSMEISCRRLTDVEREAGLDLEARESLDYLRDAGYGDLVDAMLDQSVYCVNGRLNISKLLVKLGKKSGYRLRERLEEMRLLALEH